MSKKPNGLLDLLLGINVESMIETKIVIRVEHKRTIVGVYSSVDFWPGFKLIVNERPKPNNKFSSGAPMEAPKAIRGYPASAKLKLATISPRLLPQASTPKPSAVSVILNISPTVLRRLIISVASRYIQVTDITKPK